MQLYISMVKERPSFWQEQKENVSVELPKGNLLSKEEYDNVKASYNNELFGNVYIYELELEELSLERFVELKKFMSIKDLNVIYEKYPFLLNAKSEDEDSGDGSGNLAVGMMIGHML